MTRHRFLQRNAHRSPSGARAFVAPVASAVAVAVALTASAPNASATLLDEPPRAISLKLDDPAAPKLSLLRAFYNAEIERPGPLRRYFGGPWGSWRQTPWQTLSWGLPSARGLEGTNDQGQPVVASVESDTGTGADADTQAGPLTFDPLRERLFGFEPKDHLENNLSLIPDAAASSTAWLRRLDPDWSPPGLVSTGASLASSGFDLLWTAPPKPVRDWRCRRRPVTFMRHGAESDTFALVHCDGAIAPEALDRISIMARPPEAPGHQGLLPDEPQRDAWEKREWLPQIRLVHPRLLWALQKIADAFPFRAIYIYSGYRPGAIVRGGTHQSLHAEARAMDISVFGVSNVVLFDICRKLDDVGCGFYPNSKFIHIDVRRPGVGHALWIDASGPGEPPRYVDSWPGVVIEGAMAWSSQREDPVRAGLVSGPSAVCSSGPEGAEKR